MINTDILYHNYHDYVKIRIFKCFRMLRTNLERNTKYLPSISNSLKDLIHVCLFRPGLSLKKGSMCINYDRLLITRRSLINYSS